MNIFRINISAFRICPSIQHAYMIQLKEKLNIGHWSNIIIKLWMFIINVFFCKLKLNHIAKVFEYYKAAFYKIFYTLNKPKTNDICLVWLVILMLLTSLGPVFVAFHSGADALIFNLGSSQETPKYIDIDIVWKKTFKVISNSIFLALEIKILSKKGQFFLLSKLISKCSMVNSNSKILILNKTEI